MSLRLVHLATAEGSEHENSITEGSIAKYSFTAGQLIPGKMYGFECGIVCNDNNSTDTLTAAVRFGTNATTVTSNTAIATGAAIDVADADVGCVRGTIHVQSSTRIVFMVQMTDVDAAGTITMDNHGPVLFTSAADTDYYLDITLDWSVAHADNEAAAMCFAVWEIA